MKSLILARQAMAAIVANVSQETLNRTSYCAMVLKLRDGKRAVLIAEAGATASGISGPLRDRIETALGGASGAPVIGCAAPTPGQGTWHMNDAEQQALRVYFESSQGGGALGGSVIKAVVANRAICESCSATLSQQGLQVNGAEATMP